jgi:hypothetical protein
MSPLGCRGGGLNPHETPFRFQGGESLAARRWCFVSRVVRISCVRKAALPPACWLLP